MDFSIFSKPLSVPGLGKSRMAKAKERAALRKVPQPTLELVQNGEAARFTKSRHGSPTERARGAAGTAMLPAFELDDGQNGLSAALENAALLHASGQSDVACTLLGGAISNDPLTRELPRAWHSQFDLLQRADDHAGFEQLALEYVTQFEASPPPWDDRRKAVPKSQRTLSGYFAISQVNVKTALEIPARAGRFASLKIDVSTVGIFEELGCRRMVDVLRRLRRQCYPVVFQGVENLKKQIGDKTRSGVAQNEGVWLLDLEVLQWSNDSRAFDERALEYAVTFEMSPPSWEPLAEDLLQKISASIAMPVATPAAGVTNTANARNTANATNATNATNAATAANAAGPGRPAITEAFAMKGVLAGPTDPQMMAINAFAAERTWIPIDFTQVDRIDFVCAGSMQNMLSGLIASGKEVHVIGASPIVAALLLLIGLDPDLLDNRARA